MVPFVGGGGGVDGAAGGDGPSAQGGFEAGGRLEGDDAAGHLGVMPVEGGDGVEGDPPGMVDVALVGGADEGLPRSGRRVAQFVGVTDLHRGPTAEEEHGLSLPGAMTSAIGPLRLSSDREPAVRRLRR